MNTIISKDGSKIAYFRLGEGPALIQVDGALGFPSFWGQGELEDLLSRHFTLYTYDRRGRGQSGDEFRARVGKDGWAREAVKREIEDLDALIQEAGGQAYLYGISSGGALVLEAAVKLGESKVKKIALYEAPYNDDPAGQQAWNEYVHNLGDLIAAGRNGDAVALFMKLVGAGDEDIAGMRGSPMWKAFESVGPTLAYDHTALLGETAAVPVELAACVAVPALVMNGGASFPFMAETAKNLARAIPGAQHRVLEGQTHEVAADVLAPALTEFFLNK